MSRLWDAYANVLMLLIPVALIYVAVTGVPLNGFWWIAVAASAAYWTSRLWRFRHD